MIKKVLLLLVSCYFMGCWGQDAQSAIQAFQQGWSQLNQVGEDANPEQFIEKGNNVIQLYENVIKHDSTLVKPYILFIPFRAIAYGYENKKEYKNAVIYYEKAAKFAIDYTGELMQMGLNADGYISIFESLRYAYVQTNELTKALNLSVSIVGMCKQYYPTKTAYEHFELSNLLLKMGKEKEAVEALKSSLDYYEQYGNSEQDFFITTPLMHILTYFVSNKNFEEAINYMNMHREKINTYLIGRDTLESYQLSICNACMYSAYMGVGKYNKAVDAAFLVDNYEKYLRGTNSIEHAVWMHNVACAYLNLYWRSNKQGFLTKADSVLMDVETIWRNVPHKDLFVDYATFLSTKGNIYESKGKLADAETCYKDAIRLHQSLHAEEDVIIFDLQRLAALYGKTKRKKEAISLYTSILGRYAQLSDSLGMAETCKALSILYTDYHNNQREAEYYALRAYNILKGFAPNRLLFATVEDNLANIYSNMGLLERALPYKIHSIKLRQSLGVNTISDMLDAYSSYVDVYDAVIEHSPDTVKSFLKMVIPFCKGVMKDSVSTTLQKIKSLKLLGRIDMLMKNYVDAIGEFQHCATLELKKYGRKSNQYLTTLNNLSYCYLLSGNYENCKLLAEDIIRLDKSPNSYKNYENLLGVGLLSKDSLLTEKTLRKMYEAELKYLTSQFLIMSSDQRLEFVEGDNVGLNNLTLPSMVFPNSEVCAQYAYNSALVSKELLLNTTKDIETIAASTDDNNVRTLYYKLLRVRKELNDAEDSVIIGELNKEQENTEKKLIESISSLVKYTSYLRLDWKSIKHSLQNHQVAVEFVSIDGSVLHNNEVSESYGAVLLKKDWENPRFVVLSDKVDVDKLSNRIVEAFNNGNGLKGAQWNYVGKQLFKRIWEPLTAYMDPGDTIYFAPIGLLSLVPLEALPNSEGIAIDDIFVIHRVSSTRDLCKPERPKNIDNVVLFGGLTYTAIQDTATINNFGKSRKGWQELPATADEVENITYKLKEYGIKTETFENTKGTEVAFRGLTGSQIDIIHIATHGFYFNDKESNMLQFLRSIDIKPRQDNHASPLQRTGLMLSGGQAAWLGLRKQKRDTDGILLSSEIASLDLHNVGMVVLSACQTGLGDISEDGVVGLQRAFKMAGVQTLIMTLWKVDDKATSYMMVNFYNQLLSGKDKHDAFRIAKKMVKDKFKDPFYWAPFIMLD